MEAEELNQRPSDYLMCATAQMMKHLQEAETDPVAHDTALRHST